jgi:hypothetical protein
MSSIIRRGDTYHGISVFGRGVFASDTYGRRTYAGQCKDGHACGLGVVTWSDGRKDYAEHGPDGECDGRYFDRWADGDTYSLYERGKAKDSVILYADGRCSYDGEACALDDPRLLALIAQVAPVEVRPAAPSPRPPLAPPPAPQAIVRWIGLLVFPPQALATAVATEVHTRSHAVAGCRATQPNSSRAAPHNHATTHAWAVLA